MIHDNTQSKSMNQLPSDAGAHHIAQDSIEEDFCLAICLTDAWEVASIMRSENHQRIKRLVPKA